LVARLAHEPGVGRCKLAALYEHRPEKSSSPVK
jgi:hypothetical protein